MSLQQKINDLPPIREVLSENGFFTKKTLGQNFIFDLNITDKIVRTSGNLEGALVIEIGGGAGSLSRSILKANPAKFIIIEKDERCIKILQELQQISEGKLEIINEDALKINYQELIKKYQPINCTQKPKIISNLPYNVGTELLFKWLDNASDYSSLTLMFQREVAERICAKTNDDAYGRLAVMASVLCKCKKEFDVPPTVFFPPPKIYSSIVHLQPYSKPLYEVEIDKLRKIVKSAFSQKRKMLRNTLKEIFGNDIENILQNIGIKPTSRAEEISVELFCKIANIT